jgi:hypothetical protein
MITVHIIQLYQKQPTNQLGEYKMKKTNEITIKECKALVDAMDLLYTPEEYNRLVVEIWLANDNPI